MNATPTFSDPNSDISDCGNYEVGPGDQPVKITGQGGEGSDRA